MPGVTGAEVKGGAVRGDENWEEILYGQPLISQPLCKVNAISLSVAQTVWSGSNRGLIGQYERAIDKDNFFRRAKIGRDNDRSKKGSLINVCTF